MICVRNSRQSGSGFDLDGAEARISDIELAMQAPDFWKPARPNGRSCGNHVEAGKLSKEITDLKETVSFWRAFEGQIDDPNVDVATLKKEFDVQYTKIFLSGAYDRNNAILAIHSGAGGEDARDWAGMLMDMYRKYCERSGLSFHVLDTLTAEISGPMAYG